MPSACEGASFDELRSSLILMSAADALTAVNI